MNKTITFLSLAIATLLFSTTSSAQFGCSVSIDFTTSLIEAQTEPGMCGATVNWDEPTIEEFECEGVTVSVTASHVSGEFLMSGIHTVTYTAFDEVQNQVGIGSFVIEVFDIELPVADADFLEDTYLECGVEEFDVTTIPVPTATDNCSGTIDGEYEVLDDENGFVVNWTFTDEQGNAITQSHFFGFEDTLAPVGDMEMLADVMSEDEVTELDAPTASDECTAEVTVTNDAVFPIGMGTTTVTWTYTDEAGNTSTQTQDVVVGVDSIEDLKNESFEVSIYPNPSNGEITIAFDRFDTANNDVKVYNSIGQTVYANVLTQNTSVVNLNDLNAGIYIVEINREGAVKRERLIIE